MDVELTQHEITDALIRAAREKAGLEYAHLAQPLVTLGSAYPFDAHGTAAVPRNRPPARSLLVMEHCTVTFR